MYVGPYAETDAEITLELWNHFKTLLNREDLWDVWNLEISLLPHLVEMTMRGIRVDLDRAERTKQVLIKQEKEAIKQIKSLAGMDVEIWAAQSIAKAFDKLSKYPSTEKGHPASPNRSCQNITMTSPSGSSKPATSTKPAARLSMAS